MTEDTLLAEEYPESEAFNLAISRMCFCQPGIIEKFDPATNLADVVPAIQAKITVDGSAKYQNLPLIIRVPVVIPFSQTAGLCLTVPIHKGDECLLLFSDKFIDNFVDNGGFVAPEAEGPDNLTTEIRIHHLTDAICIPGIISQPKKLPSWNQDNIELRHRERKTFLSLGPEGIKATDGQAVFTMSGGKVRFEAPAGFYVNAPNVVINDQTGNANFIGIIRAQNVETNAGFDANGHRHSGVQSGGSNTGTFV